MAEVGRRANHRREHTGTPQHARSVGRPAAMLSSALAVSECPDGASVNPCTSTLYDEGTMTVTAIVNGQQQQASADVVPCPTGDPILDNLEIRKGLEAALKQAQQNNKEMPILIMYDSILKVWSVQALEDPLASECQTRTVDITYYRAQGFNIVATAHPHIHKPGIPYSCTDPQTGRTNTVVSPDGAGVGDWPAFRAMQQNHGPHPHYIIDPEFVYPLRPGTKKGSETRNKIKKSAECGWIA